MQKTFSLSAVFKKGIFQIVTSSKCTKVKREKPDTVLSNV